MEHLTIQVLKQAYRKLKSHLYTDKTLLKEKVSISKFEEEIENNLENLLDAIKNANINHYTEDISYTLIPKKIGQNNDSEKHKLNIYSNKTKQNSYNIESYNIFIDAPIEVHLIATLWTMTVGSDIDESLNDCIKGNRLHRDINNNFLNESYKLFNPYYEKYSEFRDEAIEMATHLHEKKLDVTVLNLDIKEFYYNIEFHFNDVGYYRDIYKLNSLMQKIHSKYHYETKTLSPTKNDNYHSENYLPIGLVSSSVIANYVLQDFDKDIIENLKPEYYSRYVDDMLLVLSNEKINVKTPFSICDLLQCKTIITKFDCEDNKDTTFETNGRKFTLQKDKVKLFYFDRNDSISLLEKFKKKIEENSSFFNFLPDNDKLFKTLESSSLNICYQDSDNKISSLVGTSRDNLKIARNLTGILSTVTSTKFNTEQSEEYNSQIKNVFSGKNIFEYKSHWEKLFTYLYINRSDSLFVYMVQHFIHTIKALHIADDDYMNRKIQEDTLMFFSNSLLFSISASPNHWIKSLSLMLGENESNSLKDINKYINTIREANMFNHYLMTYPLVNFCKDIEEVDFLNQNVEMNKFFDFEIDKNKIEYSPRFIHYNEIALFYHYAYLNGVQYPNSEIDVFIYETYREFNKLENFLEMKVDCIDDTRANKVYDVGTDNQDNIKKDKLKIGIVSIKINLQNTIDSYVSSPNLAYSRFKDIVDTLNQSIDYKHKVDLLIFPEISIPYAWVHIMAKFAKKNNIGIIFGIEHIKIDKKVYNYTCVMLPFRIGNHTNLFINFDLKHHYSPVEKMDIESRGFEIQIDKEKCQYLWRGNVFSTFNCYELTDINLRSNLVGNVDFLVAIEYNKDTNYFSNIIDSLSRDVHCYVIQVNTSDYGDSRIVQPSETITKDIVKIKGGENIYLVVSDIDIQILRNFQKKGHYLQSIDSKFKMVPPNFEMSRLRE